MKYRMMKENRTTLKNFGRWRAVAVHSQTVETRQIIKEVCRRTGASRGSVVAVLTELAGVVSSHLRAGDRVRIDDFGLLKLEIEGEKVDSADDFCAEEHIRGVRLHVLAESRHGRQSLYDGIKYEQVNAGRSTGASASAHAPADRRSASTDADSLTPEPHSEPLPTDNPPESQTHHGREVIKKGLSAHQASTDPTFALLNAKITIPPKGSFGSPQTEGHPIRPTCRFLFQADHHYDLLLALMALP